MHKKIIDDIIVKIHALEKDLKHYKMGPITRKAVEYNLKHIIGHLRELKRIS